MGLPLPAKLILLLTPLNKNEKSEEDDADETPDFP